MNLERSRYSLRKNDQVEVMTGREKGKTGKVLKVDAKAGRIVVEKINMVKRHTRPTQTSAGGIMEKEGSIHYSNVLLMCPKCNRGVRHGHKFVEKPGKAGQAGKVQKVKIRVCKRCGESLDVA